ncbi:hypothetical protein CR970_02095 [Candidatus Saccharibacteria bacterium]|nr:MAG: hypothetical protein CR970_02095 [Candidatus Saccharibacteria bacterium]
MSQQKNVRSDQRGLAAFIVVFIIMLILTLILLGFSRIIRREQQQVLDRTLSNRAFYAAESGVNVVMERIRQGTVSDKTDCGPSSGVTSADLQVDPDASTNTRVTCLTVDTTPNDLVYGSAPANQAFIAPFTAPEAVSSITFGWENPAVGTAPSYGCGGFDSPAAASWNCGAAMLRVDIVPVGAGMTRQSLIDNMFSVYMYPSGSGGGSVSYTTGAAAKGVKGLANCSASPTGPDCQLTVQGLGALGASEYSLRIMSMYQPAAITITPRNAAGSSLPLSDAQVVIDSTGRAQDVVKRVRVRKSLNTVLVPNYALQSADSLCKRMIVGSGTVSASYGIIGGTPAGLANPCVGWL